MATASTTESWEKVAGDPPPINTHARRGPGTDPFPVTVPPSKQLLFFVTFPPVEVLSLFPASSGCDFLLFWGLHHARIGRRPSFLFSHAGVGGFRLVSLSATPHNAVTCASLLRLQGPTCWHPGIPNASLMPDGPHRRHSGSPHLDLCDSLGDTVVARCTKLSFSESQVAQAEDLCPRALLSHPESWAVDFGPELTSGPRVSTRELLSPRSAVWALCCHSGLGCV